MLNINYPPKIRKLVFVLIPLIFLSLCVLLGTLIVGKRTTPQTKPNQKPVANVIYKNDCSGVEAYNQWFIKELKDYAFQEISGGKYLVLKGLVNHTTEGIFSTLPLENPFKVKVPEGWTFTKVASSGGSAGGITYTKGAASINHSLPSEGGACLLKEDGTNTGIGREFASFKKIDSSDSRYVWYLAYVDDSNKDITVCGYSTEYKQDSTYGATLTPVGSVTLSNPEDSAEAVKDLDQYIKDIEIL